MNDERRLQRAAEELAQERASAIEDKERALAQQGEAHAQEIARLRAQIATGDPRVRAATPTPLAVQLKLRADGSRSDAAGARIAAPTDISTIPESFARALRAAGAPAAGLLFGLHRCVAHTLPVSFRIPVDPKCSAPPRDYHCSCTRVAAAAPHERCLPSRPDSRIR